MDSQAAKPVSEGREARVRTGVTETTSNQPAAEERAEPEVPAVWVERAAMAAPPSMWTWFSKATAIVPSSSRPIRVSALSAAKAGQADLPDRAVTREVAVVRLPPEIRPVKAREVLEARTVFSATFISFRSGGKYVYVRSIGLPFVDRLQRLRRVCGMESQFKVSAERARAVRLLGTLQPAGKRSTRSHPIFIFVFL
jgi:hypothetical protein